MHLLLKSNFLEFPTIRIEKLRFAFVVCKQANRALRQATLGTLNSLIVAYGDKIGLSAYEVIIVELSGLIRFVLKSSICTSTPAMWID